MGERYGPNGLGLAPLPKQDVPGSRGKPGRKKSTYVTQWCVNGSHEGKPKKPSENSEHTWPECLYGNHCTCECHDKMAKLRGMMSLPEPEFLIPGAPPPAVVLDGGAVSIRIRPTDAELVENLTPAQPPADGKRGHLEHKVYEFCKKHVDMGLHKAGVLNVGYIVLGVSDGDYVPSNGAVNAVLQRWATSGFAVVAKSPTRLMDFTEAGIKLGLQGFRAVAKR